MATNQTAKTGQPIIRALRQGIALRSTGASDMPTLHGHFAVFDRWTEINSWSEGHFLERIAPGAFKKTFREQTPKVLFQHGQDAQIGDKPLGTVESLAEDDQGAAYAVRMLDTSYNRDLIPGLEAGLYGASFRFSVMREQRVEHPEPSDYNPDGIEERTIKEARVAEFGPVTFPAYSDASAAVRSLTDRFLFDAIERDPKRARDLLSVAQRDALRMDVEDLGSLAEMILCGTNYIAEQDEPGDQANIPKMEAILAMIADLVPVEVAENEPPEDELNAAGKTGATRTLPATTPPSKRTPALSGSRATTGTSTDPERRAPRFQNEKEWYQWLTQSAT